MHQHTDKLDHMTKQAPIPNNYPTSVHQHTDTSTAHTNNSTCTTSTTPAETIHMRHTSQITPPPPPPPPHCKRTPFSRPASHPDRRLRTYLGFL
ncbi:hypothetical protein BaRGS_00037476, partial [Batillaria attramentaria]